MSHLKLVHSVDTSDDHRIARIARDEMIDFIRDEPDLFVDLSEESIRKWAKQHSEEVASRERPSSERALSLMRWIVWGAVFAIFWSAFR